MKTKWLNRQIAPSLPYLTLCLSQEEFDRVLKYIKYTKEKLPFVTDGYDAKVYHLNHEDGDKICVVCMKIDKTKSVVQHISLLVHESMHIWREYKESINENYPAAEQEAYAVQFISQELITEYLVRIKHKKLTVGGAQ